MLLTIFWVVFHLLPDFILNDFGVLSDVISDFSPAILRPVEHVVFSFLLN